MTHRCTKCRETKPLDSFEKHRRGSKRAAWYCDDCQPPSTERTRRYRQDEAKREKDRERSRRWKREHLGQPGLPKGATRA